MQEQINNMNYINKKLEEFDENQGKSIRDLEGAYCDEMGCDCDYQDYNATKSFLKQALEEQREEIADAVCDSAFLAEPYGTVIIVGDVLQIINEKMK